MSFRTRDRVPALTGVLSAVSLALVFGAVLGVVPATALPRGPEWVIEAVPHVNAALSALAIVAIAVGWRAVRRGDVARHRRSMLAALGLFATFLVLYLYRIVLEGPTAYEGAAVLERFVYLPVLTVHVALAILCIPLLYYVLLLALTRPASELSDTLHPRLGRVAASLWLVSFALGIVVYGLLYAV